MSEKELTCALSFLPHRKSFEEAVRKELENTKGCPEMFLRAETDLSGMLKSICFEQAREYFSYGLQYVFGKSALYTSAHSNMDHNSTENQLAAIASIIERLNRVSSLAPANLRMCCQHILSESQSVFHDRPNVIRYTVGNLIVLRMICPILVQPEKIGFPSHTKSLFLFGVQLAKIIQHTLYGRLFDASVHNAGQLNAFVRTYEPNLLAFLANISSPHQETQPTVQVCCRDSTESLTDSYSQHCTDWMEQRPIKRHVSAPNKPSMKDHNPKQRKSFSRILWQKVKNEVFFST